MAKSVAFEPASMKFSETVQASEFGKYLSCSVNFFGGRHLSQLICTCTPSSFDQFLLVEDEIHLNMWLPLPPNARDEADAAHLLIILGVHQPFSEMLKPIALSMQQQPVGPLVSNSCA